MAECVPVPSGLSRLQLENFILNTVTNGSRWAEQPISLEDREILTMRQYGNVRFDFPDEIGGPLLLS